MQKRLGKVLGQVNGEEITPQKISFHQRQIQDKLLGMHNLIKEIEGNNEEMSIDVKNFEEEIIGMDNQKKVEIPGVKIRNHLDIWE